MSTEITMPKLSDTMEEGKILRWLKHAGDQIHRGDPIAEIETDKADMVMEAFDDGLLDEILVKDGESAKVGTVIAVLRSTSDSAQPVTRATNGMSGQPGVAEQLGQTRGGAITRTKDEPPDGAQKQTPETESQRGRVAPLR